MMGHEGIEVAERLAPKFSTTRELFVHSGNECAFPNCTRRLVNQKGQWLGEICHIESALPGGERFNPEMTNDARRAAPNLMLMCHDHHVETDDALEFPVERMKEIKAEHEAAFADAPAPLADDALAAAVKEIVESDIVDRTDRVVLHLPQTLATFGAVLKLNETPEELQSDIVMMTPRLEALRRIPVDTRAIFAVVVDRGSNYYDALAVPAHELDGATGLSPNEIQLHVATLERYELASFDEEYNDYKNLTIMWVKTSGIDGWDFWGSLRDFCQAKGLECKQVIKELRFDQLD
jgi:hypothetical protein